MVKPPSIKTLRRRDESPVYMLARSFSGWVFSNFYGVEIRGLENFPETGPFLLASNHASYFDPPLAGYRVPRPIYYFARKTLFRNPVFGWLIHELNSIPVDRDASSDVTALKTVFKVLKAGSGLIVFPEGTRTVDGNLQPARAGVGMLACKSQAPVVPCRLFGTYEAYGKGMKLPRIGVSLSVVYGPPLYPVDYDPGGKGKDRYQIAAERIMEAISKLEEPSDRNV